MTPFLWQIVSSPPPKRPQSVQQNNNRRSCSEAPRMLVSSEPVSASPCNIIQDRERLTSWLNEESRRKRWRCGKKWRISREGERREGLDYTLIVDSLLTGRFLVWVSEQFISVLKHWCLQKAGAEDEGQGMKNIKPHQYQANITNTLRPPPTNKRGRSEELQFMDDFVWLLWWISKHACLSTVMIDGMESKSPTFFLAVNRRRDTLCFRSMWCLDQTGLDWFAYRLFSREACLQRSTLQWQDLMTWTTICRAAFYVEKLLSECRHQKAANRIKLTEKSRRTAKTGELQKSSLGPLSFLSYIWPSSG